MSKFKNWLKENGLYVLGGLATAGVMVAAVIKGLKPDDTVIDPYVIDRGKDDWMDELKTDRWILGKELTIREALAVGDYYVYTVKQLSPDIDDVVDINKGFLKVENPKDIEVLNSIEGPWKYTKTEE